MNHYNSLKDYVIIGDGLTNKSIFLNGYTPFDSVDVYTSTEKYSKYDTKRIKGALSEATLTINAPTGKVEIEVDTTVIPSDQNSYSVIGTLNGVKHLLHAVNRQSNGTLSNIVYMSWSHYHPNLVTKY